MQQKLFPRTLELEPSTFELEPCILWVAETSFCQSDLFHDPQEGVVEAKAVAATHTPVFNVNSILNILSGSSGSSTSTGLKPFVSVHVLTSASLSPKPLHQFCFSNSLLRWYAAAKKDMEEELNAACDALYPIGPHQPQQEDYQDARALGWGVTCEVTLPGMPTPPKPSGEKVELKNERGVWFKQCGGWAHGLGMFIPLWRPMASV